MALDLLTIIPHKVKSGIQGKMYLLYGGPKTNKTTTASKFPKPLILAAEMGYGLLDGVMAAPITSWVDVKNYLKQLKKPEVREMYETIVLDTVDIFWSLCEKFIKTQKDIEDLSELGYGRGYRAVRDEFQDTINSLGQMGYTLVFISHAEKKDYQDSVGVTHSGITPTLDKRPKEFISGLVDVMAFVCQEPDSNGVNRPVAYLRGGKYGEIEIEAGSRYGEGLPRKIEFNYDELAKAIQSADEAMLSAGVEISADNKTILETTAEEQTSAKKSFAEVYQEAGAVLDKLKARIAGGETDLADKVRTTIENYLGAGRKIQEATPAQQDLVEAAIKDLKEL